MSWCSVRLYTATRVIRSTTSAAVPLASVSFTYVATRLAYDSSVDSETRYRECAKRADFSHPLGSARSVRVSLGLSAVAFMDTENSGTHSCTFALLRESAQPTTMRLSTSADEVQGLLDRDFSSSTAEYVVIGFCGDTPTRRRRRRENRRPVSISVDSRSKRRPYTATVTGNLDTH